MAKLLEMENINIKELAKSALDPASLEILRLSLDEDLYPSQIAEMLNRTSSYVVKKLKKLEKYGVVKSSYVTRDGKATKKYQLLNDELVFRIDLKNANVRLEKMGSSYLDRFAETRPELFQSFEDYVLWSTGKIHPKKVASYFDVPIEEAEKLLIDIREDIERVFWKACQTSFKKWKYGMESGYIDFVEDWLIIPAQRLSLGREGRTSPLVDRIRQGETYLSLLEKDFQKNDLLGELKKLERERRLFLEREYRPTLVNYKINLKTKQMMEEGGSEELFSMGKQVGAGIAKFIDLPLDRTLSSLFGRVGISNMGEEIAISLQDCRVCEGIKGEKVCGFVSGVLESVLATNGIDATVWETSCKAEESDACVFHGEITPMEPFPNGADKIKQLLGG